jgi:ATP-dependent DNA helicase RecG
MNRLLEGDVGSGKTLVALLSMLTAVRAGYQTAILAPTEILARQHYQTFRSHLEQNPILKEPANVGLLTSQFHEINGRNISKEHVIMAINRGEVSMVIGTHALLQGAISFKKLGLVVIDEQHRFGVEQRAMLLKRRTPHLLSMSATPIPRTLALAFYGDLDISTLTEQPKGRQKIITRVVAEEKRPAAYEFIKKQLRDGHQAFVITPRVEESERQQIKSVKKEFERLATDIFPE